jgi:molybdenum cofactor cytidylyltransferase
VQGREKDLRTQVVELNQAVGRLLTTPVFQNGSGKKLLAKGHLISEEDIRLLLTAGQMQVVVAQLEENDIPEEEAALTVASESACGSMEIHMAAGGRANLLTTEDSCLLVDDDLLEEINSSGCVTMATLSNLAFAAAGQRVATVKTAPFAVPRDEFQRVVQLVRQRGPILQARPIREPAIGVLYSDPCNADRSRALFEGIMKTRLERLRTAATFALSAKEEEVSVARGLEYLLRARPTLILVASTTAPAGPDDVVGRAMRRIGCQLERFLAPVEPGNLLMLCYAGETPVVTAPGCFRSPKPNVVDLILPPLLARYRVTGREVSALGLGGLLQ